VYGRQSRHPRHVGFGRGYILLSQSPGEFKFHTDGLNAGELLDAAGAIFYYIAFEIPDIIDNQ